MVGLGMVLFLMHLSYKVLVVVVLCPYKVEGNVLMCLYRMLNTHDGRSGICFCYWHSMYHTEFIY